MRCPARSHCLFRASPCARQRLLLLGRVALLLAGEPPALPGVLLAVPAAADSACCSFCRLAAAAARGCLSCSSCRRSAGQSAARGSAASPRSTAASASSMTPARGAPSAPRAARRTRWCRSPGGRSRSAPGSAGAQLGDRRRERDWAGWRCRTGEEKWSDTAAHGQAWERARRPAPSTPPRWPAQKPGASGGRAWEVRGRGERREIRSNS